MVREGDAAPGLATGITIQDLHNGYPSMNSQGKIIFQSALGGPGVSSSNYYCLWTNRTGALQLIAREGDQAPGTITGTKFGTFSYFEQHPAINETAHIAFRADTIYGIFSTSGSGIWTDRSGTLELYKKDGDAAPGTPTGVIFSNLSAPVLNDQDKIAFKARLGGNVSPDKDTGLWSDNSGTLMAIALEGSAAAGLPDGVVYDDFFKVSNNFVLNSSGKIAFLNPFTGTEGGTGIWAQDPYGNLLLIARTGAQLEVLPNDFRTIASLGFTGGSGNGDSLASGFDDLGGVSFRARFTDNSSGVFYSTAAIPEPSTYFLLALGGLASLWQLKSRTKFLDFTT